MLSKSCQIWEKYKYLALLFSKKVDRGGVLGYNLIKDEEYASGLDKEMSIFFDKKINEFYSTKNIKTNEWNLEKF